MATDFIKWQQELEDAKHTLVALNDNIRRIIGRNPKDIRTDKQKISNDSKRIEADRPGQRLNDISKFKRRSYDAKSVFNRLSAPAARSSDEESKPRLNSRVIRELPTRQEVVAAQGIDSESRARNRRMFGSLLGTLHKFCQEESRLKQREDKKAQIEKKLEEQEIQERETLKRERELLFIDRKRKQLEIRQLEMKMNRLKDFEVWESSTRVLKKYIRTKSKPYIYFRPRVMCKKTEKLLLESQNLTDNIIANKRDILKKEFIDIENNLKIHDFEKDHFENIDNDISCEMNVMDRTQELDTKTDYRSDKVNKTVSEAIIKKGDFDTKENKSRNLNEPPLSSSVVVVKSLQKDLNKIQ